MIEVIKKTIKNYLGNAKLTEMTLGSVQADGIRVSDKMVVPNELIKGNLKDFVSPGDRVRLIRNTGGQEFYIVEIIGFAPAIKDRTLLIEPITIGSTTISSIKIKDVVK